MPRIPGNDPLLAIRLSMFSLPAVTSEHAFRDISSRALFVLLVQKYYFVVQPARQPCWLRTFLEATSRSQFAPCRLLSTQLVMVLLTGGSKMQPGEAPLGVTSGDYCIEGKPFSHLAVDVLRLSSDQDHMVLPLPCPPPPS